ncbi:hypothetical protein IP88_03845, partial [alpha proteobacterium AAP81b]
MANLVFGGLGRAIAGPIGGLVGATLGGIADRALFGDGGVRRLPDLTVQSAAYGEAIPVISGRMRVAGNLIWTSGIAESRSRGRGSGGKRGAPTPAYSYSASFAVGLAAGEIARIGRIWADGRLLRDAAGAWTTPVTMRLHRGSETQAVDPLIAAAEGDAPAYRGLAYVVFEDLALADWGNRIPALSFEVIADAGEAIGLDAAIARLSRGAVSIKVAGAFPTVTGHVAARPGTIAEALAPLLGLADAAVLPGPVIQGDGGTVMAIDPADFDAAVPGARPPPERRERAPAAVQAHEIGFYDSSRDYQPGLQRIDRGGGTTVSQALPCALAPEVAKRLAARAAARRESARVTATLRLPWRALPLVPGSLVRARDETMVFRVTAQRFENFVVSLDLERVDQVAPPAATADGGRVAVFDDAPPGPTTLLALDL